MIRALLDRGEDVRARSAMRNADGKPLVNVGFVYRSAFTLNLRGQFLVNGAVAANTVIPFNMPQVFTGAIALWPVRDQDHEWKLELALDYTTGTLLGIPTCTGRPGQRFHS